MRNDSNDRYGVCLRPPAVLSHFLLQFDDDFYEFRCSIKELERRLGAVVSLAFDDCATVYGRFKLLDSFEGLLERPIIQVSLRIATCLNSAELRQIVFETVLKVNRVTDVRIPSPHYASPTCCRTN